MILDPGSCVQDPVSKTLELNSLLNWVFFQVELILDRGRGGKYHPEKIASKQDGVLVRSAGRDNGKQQPLVHGARLLCGFS